MESTALALAGATAFARAMRPELRGQLHRLRRDALDELALDDRAR
ncbi:MAG: hypothetical protein AAB011_12075 [Candidatus Eisenbacteria bacterium]